MSAGHYGLDNLIAIIDRNHLQIDGTTEEVMEVSPLREKYEAFGWNVLEIDGHNMEEILSALQVGAAHEGAPTLILAETIKGCGVSYTAGVCGYHGVPPKDGLCGDESLATALADLEMDQIITQERLDRMLTALGLYQQAVEEYVDALLPRFSRNYWWNESEGMQVKMDATRNGFGHALGQVSARPNATAIGSDITSSIRMDRFYQPDGKNPDPDRIGRWFSLGIQEANATTVAAGMAKEGLLPFIGSYGCSSPVATGTSCAPRSPTTS